MTNGYSTSTKSRSCENNLDTCGRKVSDELAISSSSLIDLPTPSSTSHADYDNLPVNNGHDESDGKTIGQHSSVARVPTQAQSPISGELDQKTKEAIDARLKEIDDEFEFDRKARLANRHFAHGALVPVLLVPFTAVTVNKSVDLPSARRLAKRLYTLDGFKSNDVVRHLCKR